MTEQTEAAEVEVLRALLAEHDDAWHPTPHSVGAHTARDSLLAKLVAREAAAEARGAERALREAAERIAATIEACCKARVENNDQRLNFSKGATAAYTHAARIARAAARGAEEGAGA